ncbi:acyl carrier protein [Streptomyces sp. NPDC127098]|uniref:acyl carrier protein n=1 Tax=Streptomyces sp. NPDC127098 TaxID=3347137 RepID=UPI00364B1980
MDPVHDHLTTVLTNKFEVAPGDVRPEATLTELGLDSLSATELAVTLQEHWGVEVPEDAFTGESTVRDVVTRTRDLLDDARRPTARDGAE